MALPQTKFREIIFQLLYSKNCGDWGEEEIISIIMQELAVTKSAVRHALQQVKEIISHLEEIDLAIAKISHSYTFERIQSVELNILRLGAFELIFGPEIPPRVAIAESMRLARKFGSPESAAFVNAILDNMFQSMQGKQINQQLIEKGLSKMEESDHLSKIGSEVREQEKMKQLPDKNNAFS